MTIHPATPLLPLVIAMSVTASAWAQETRPTLLPEVIVVGDAWRNSASNPPARAVTSDSARLLDHLPGFSVAAGGGVSGLPIVNGLADDRIKILVDGLDITSACGNHMNAPLSYIDPKQIASISLIAGITPVSVGGDSIAATIVVQSPAPVFAAPGEGLHQEGSFSASGRTVNGNVALGLRATMASENLSLSYNGAHARGSSYKDGNGNKVLDTLYESENQSLTLAARGDGQLWTLRIGEQHIPYQGFPNQYMDMTGNRSESANLAYAGDVSWGKLQASLTYQDTKHSMGFFSQERDGTMPMNTHGRDTGYTVRAEIPVLQSDTLRLGHEYHGFRLDDEWPAVTTGSMMMMMMGPNNYININGGTRDRLAFYAEQEHRFSAQWSSLIGVRDEFVKTNTGNVQAYGSAMLAADNAAASAFNSRDHARRDNNIDLTVLARFEPDASANYEFGYARKTRSPNLYERYTWGRSTMAMTMTNWFGDGNGYVGDVDLKPEVAHTLSATADWHDALKQDWNLRVTPYVTDVKNYIDADVIGTFHPYSVASANGNLLRFANHDARLYGVNLDGQASLWRNAAWGEVRLAGNASLTRGSRTDGGDLYRQMPFNARLAIEQSSGAWVNVIETRVVARKTRVDNQRLESTTAGYALFNVRTAWQLNKAVALNAGISNLFNRAYADPLGGVDLAGLASAMAGSLQTLAGPGRSLDLGASVRF